MNKLYDINLEGIGKINGGEYKDIKISGVGTILNDITCEKASLEGVCKVNGSINCNDIYIEGKFNSNSSIEANNKVHVNGYVKLGQSIQGREINIYGKVQVNGLLTGDEIKILFMGKNKVKEIGGEVITALEEKKSFINGTIIPNKLICDSIEGDIIVLQNTECSMVRGKNITIKSGCRIKRVEYSGEIYIDEKSKVENVVKL
jgi:cytoskeletal protein CcmA (bactofilin family)